MRQLRCPKCSREFVRRVPRFGLSERLAGWFYFYPFKCQICSFRFHLFQLGKRYLRVAEDAREYDRRELHFPIAFRADRCDGRGNVLNIGMGGCSFTTPAQLAKDSIIRLELQISKHAVPVIVDAAVLRHWHNQIAGVEFLRFQKNQRERLRLFVRNVKEASNFNGGTEPHSGIELRHAIESRPNISGLSSRRLH